MLKINKRGFTLIELLVVIAIIGILASIVLVSLNDARNKGYDTQIKSDISQTRTTIELCYDNMNGTYIGCAQEGTNGIADITPPSCQTVQDYVITVTATDYAVSGQLCSDAALFWCVDTAGNAGVGTAVSIGGACT